MRWVAVGTGKALEMGQKLTMSTFFLCMRQAQRRHYVKDGYGVHRTHRLCINDFVIVGPAEDPAGVKSLSAADAFNDA